ncbi:hypothetical protein [Pyramidobacter sp. C12-8]|uniref:hypothetical protein n=1 Tax=Pyramidobacter sp. C12-8 TaxID=1943580 RepID=UPI00098F9D6F|nr:hypothetical protein [Pyramidobacter sp. C12-8]OON88832.1 hypothetical protein B0D78_06865 [Pyramidobacter sp. C12-8]
MQEQIDTSAVDPIPDEEAFRRALAQIETFGKQIFRTAERQKDLLLNEKEQNARETIVLRKRLDERENELETLRKNLMDAQMELSEARRSEASLKLEIKQLKEQVSIYRVDARRIEEAESQLRTAKEEAAHLRARIEELNTEAVRAVRKHKTEVDALTLKYEQEKVALHESVQIAEDRARSAAETVARTQSLGSIAEHEKNAALEELARSKREQKQQLEKLQNDLARREAAASELERRFADQQREYERKLSLIQLQTGQQYQSQMEALKNVLEDKAHELNRAHYQIEQLNDDHRRALEALKQDMEKQLELRADEIRRRLILKSTGKDGRPSP